MSEHKIIDIIKLCLALDIKAVDIYARFSQLTDNEKLRRFWLKISNEEREHVKFWKELVLLSDQNEIPQMFENYQEVKSDLTKINNKVKKLFDAKSNSSDMDTSQMFLLAYRLEFYLLHPAFEKLFHYAKFAGLVKSNPEEKYSNHLKKFIAALNKFGKSTQNVELLGETLKRLWIENRNLARQSLFDNLTGVLNRRGFFDSVKPLSHLAQRKNMSIGILMIDIDNFKNVNDTFGHMKGDRILRSTAQVLAHSIRSSDIIGRYGGEEFIIYLSSIEPESLYETAHKIREKIEKSEKLYGLPITVSIGAASRIIKENVEKEMSTLITRADSCLYKAKRKGKNTVEVYTS